MAPENAERVEEERLSLLEKGLDYSLSARTGEFRRLELLRSRVKMAVLTVLGCLSLFILYTTALPQPATRHPFSSNPSGRGRLKLKINHEGTLSPSINANFPDPSILQGHNGSWYSFATNGNGKHVQAAKADSLFGEWNLLDVDPLPDAGWTTGSDYWAPDVRRLDNGSYIMYYSGQLPDIGSHCIGTGRSSDILGPYIPDPDPFVCHTDQGGAIDPAGFLDPTTGLRYVVYKVDGNAHGNGGDCNNGVGPLVSTPIMLQQVDRHDGSTKIGEPVEILDRTPADGPLVEAPNLVRLDGRYVLFFSSHCYAGVDYDIKYAYSDDIGGPYTRGGGDMEGEEQPMIAAPQFGLNGPGGMTSTEEGDRMVFHGWCNGERRRCMYSVSYGVEYD